MFQLRSKPLLRKVPKRKKDDYDYLDRQIEIWDALTHRDALLNTKTKLLAVAVFNITHADLNIIAAKRIEKLLPDVQEALGVESMQDVPLDDLINDKDMHAKIVEVLRPLLDDVKMLSTDHYELSRAYIDLDSCKREMNVFKRAVKEELKVGVMDLLRTPVKPHSSANIHDFQMLFFGPENLKYLAVVYYTDTMFSLYLFYNCLSLLKVHDISQIQWDALDKSSRDYVFAYTARLIHVLSYSDAAVKELFYLDKLVLEGEVYSLELIPKYDVKRIAPLEKHMQELEVDKQPFIDYWNELKILPPSKLTAKRPKLTIPMKFQPIFKTFPLKDGHFILPTNDIYFLNLPQPTSSLSYIEGLMSLCTLDNLETYIHDLLQFITPMDILIYAAHVNDLKRLGIALAMLYIYYGAVYSFVDKLTGTRHDIPLPSLNEVLMWLDYSETCDAVPKVIFPCAISDDSVLEKVRTNHQFARCQTLIQTIASLADSPLNACILCSAFFIPEIFFQHLYSMYSDGDQDNHLYVLLTIVMQQYNFSYFYAKRQSLKPVFVRNIQMDVQKDLWEPFVLEFQAYPQVMQPNVKLERILTTVKSTLSAKMASRPTLVGAKLKLICYSHVRNNFQKYRFFNKRLHALVRQKTQIKLENSEIARLLYMLLRTELFSSE